MSPTFTDDDIGKSVETDAGEILGVVADVDPETAYVEPTAGVTDSTKAVLEWERDAAEAVPLADDAVSEVTDDAIRLETDFPPEAITSGSTAENGDSSGEGDAREDDASEDVDFAPGESVTSNPTEPATDVDGSDGLETRDLEDAEPMVADDEFYDDAEGGARVDPDAEMEPPEGDEADETEETAVPASDEPGDASDLEVDPEEATDGDPNAELEPDEDVGRRREPGEDRDD